jgi:predicted RNase H-like nuclease (RuvC/YqgF family)|tara:strand:+ start:1813 stop:2001 length:189 start_codon:yes stop_codon:yes gene_type:complete
MKDDKGDLDLTKQIEKLQRQIEDLKAELSRAKEDHQYDILVHKKELENLRNPVKQFRNKGII